MFHPMRGAMALSELLIGLLPVTAPVQWATGDPLVAYNVAFVLSFPLCALAAYMLAQELTGRTDCAFIAGLAFAFGPYRMNELSHLQMLSYYWAPVTLLALHRYVSRSSPKWLVLFAAAWLMQALSNGYALFHVSVLVVLWIVWFVRDMRKAAAIAAAWLVAALPLVPALFAYRAIHERLHLARDINEIRRFSADLAGFLSAPPELALWGGRLLESHVATAMFPGATVVVVLMLAAAGATLAGRSRGRARPGRARLAIGSLALLFAVVALSAVAVGPWALGPLVTVSSFHKPFSIAVAAGLLWFVLGPWWQERWHARSAATFYAGAALTMYVLALGPEPSLLGAQILYEPPYAWLMRLPGFDVLRVPARFGMAAIMCQAMVVALVLARWLPNVAARRVVVGLVSAGILADGWVSLPVVVAPADGTGSVWQSLAASPSTGVIEIPPGEPVVDFPALYRSMFHRLPLANGFSGFAPPHYLPLIYAIGHGRFEALEEMSTAGPLGVVVDRSLPWRDAMESSLSRLASARPLGSDDRWTAFVVSAGGPSESPIGPRIYGVRVRANRRPMDAGSMVDGSVETAWGPGTPQDGREEVILEIDPVRAVGSVVLKMGAYSFGFPRELAIDVSDDGRQWSNAWQGETSVLTVRAALADPSEVPVRIDVFSRAAAFLRLRQVGRDATVPWWIAEVALHAH
jgi:hypothetical protein